MGKRTRSGLKAQASNSKGTCPTAPLFVFLSNLLFRVFRALWMSHCNLKCYAAICCVILRLNHIGKICYKPLRSIKACNYDHLPVGARVGELTASEPHLQQRELWPVIFGVIQDPIIFCEMLRSWYIAVKARSNANCLLSWDGGQT